MKKFKLNRGRPVHREYFTTEEAEKARKKTAAVGTRNLEKGELEKQSQKRDQFEAFIVNSEKTDGLTEAQAEKKLRITEIETRKRTLSEILSAHIKTLKAIPIELSKNNVDTGGPFWRQRNIMNFEEWSEKHQEKYKREEVLSKEFTSLRISCLSGVKGLRQRNTQLSKKWRFNFEKKKNKFFLLNESDFSELESFLDEMKSIGDEYVQALSEAKAVLEAWFDEHPESCTTQQLRPRVAPIFATIY